MVHRRGLKIHSSDNDTNSAKPRESARQARRTGPRTSSVLRLQQIADTLCSLLQILVVSSGHLGGFRKISMLAGGTINAIVQGSNDSKGRYRTVLGVSRCRGLSYSVTTYSSSTVQLGVVAMGRPRLIQNDSNQPRGAVVENTNALPTKILPCLIPGPCTAYLSLNLCPLDRTFCVLLSSRSADVFEAFTTIISHHCLLLY